ncbi:MAG: sulfatase [Planctomycetota bacterium]
MTAEIEIRSEDDIENWIIEAPAHELIPRGVLEPGQEGFALKMRMAPGAQGRAKRVSFPGPFAPQEIDSVGLKMVFFEKEAVRVGFERGGETVILSDYQQVEDGELQRNFVFEFPQMETETEALDALVIETRGYSPLVCFLGAHLIEHPLESLLPAAQDGARAVAIGLESRLATGLTSRQPLTAECILPPRAQLSFSYGQPARLRRPDQGVATIVLTIEGARGGREVHEFPISSNQAWNFAELDLDAFADARAKFRFEVHSEGGQAALVALGEPTVFQQVESPFTVLLVTSDTHRFDSLGMTSSDDALRTETMDTLARSGVFFENVYSSTNVTNPSHIALMTATHPRDTAIVDNTTGLAEVAPTLADAFHARGFVTFACVSAAHLGDPISGLGQGFDRMSYPDLFARDAEITIAELQSWLPQARQRPLFVWLHLFDAHTPYRPPGDYNEMYWEGGDPFDASLPEPSIEGTTDPDSLLPRFLKGLRDFDFPEAQYKAEITYLDDQLGKLLAIDRFQGALVAVTADHGECLGEHGNFYSHAGTFPANLHVPLILHGPEVAASGLPAGTRVPEPALHTDLGRTILNLAGMADVAFPGRDLLELARRERGADDTRFFLSANGFDASINKNGWHYFLQLEDTGQTNVPWATKRGDERLFDTNVDEDCAHDLASAPEFANKRNALRTELIEWLKSPEPTGWSRRGQVSELQLQHLSDLGYAQADEFTGEPATWWKE